MADDQSLTRIRTLAPGATLVEQGETGDGLFLLLEGTLTAEVDGHPLAELGPGSILGERALVEGRRQIPTPRTATLRAKTRSRIAVAAAHELRGLRRSSGAGIAVDGTPPLTSDLGVQTSAV